MTDTLLARNRKQAYVGLANGRYVHGARHIPEYNAWVGAKRRCYNTNALKYPSYGGRGITMCDRWLNDFAAFYTDLGPKPTPRHSLDRIDNDGPYSPDNCRWADAATQRANQRIHKSARFVEWQGQSYQFCELARHLGIPESTLDGRLRRGVPLT